MRLSAMLALMALSATNVAQAAGCAGGEDLPKFAHKRIVLADDTLYFRSDSLALDQDGSPEAYGIRDQGFEDICNGLGPLKPDACRGRNQKPCYEPCQSAFAAWSAQGASITELGAFMCAIGLGGGGCSPPAPRLQPAPRQDWFVSETSVRVSPTGAAASDWSGSQAAQIDPRHIPYFVIPNGFRKLPWDATPGDAGVVLDARTGRTIAFVVGDTGGALDEASFAVHAALRGGVLPPRSQRTSALGQSVERYLTGSTGDFRIAIFRHTSSRIGTSSMLSLTADALAPWIDTTAGARLASIGGLDRLRNCTQ